MPIEVELPDGSIAEFPDGTPDNVMKNALSKFAQPKGRTWSDVPGEAFGNIPSSAAKFASDIVQPFLSPVETVKNLSDAAAGGLRAGAKAVLPTGVFNAIDNLGAPENNQRIEQTAGAVGQFFKDRYGSADAIKNTIATDPVGALGDASLVLTGGGSIAARGPGIVSRGGRAIQATGQAVDPLNLAGRAVSAVGQIPPNVLGVTAGTGAEPIKEAFRAGRQGRTAFAENMRGRGDPDKIVGMAEQGVAAMGKERSAAYRAGTETLRQSQALIGLKPVKDSLRTAYNDVVYTSGGKTFVKDDAAVRALGQVAEKVNDFEQMAPGIRRRPEAIDALKQSIGGIYEGLEQGTRAHKVVGGIYNDIKKLIVDELPDYAKTMKDYSNASEKIEEVRKTLSIRDTATTDTALRKLQSVMRNNVNTNYGARTKLVDELNRYQPDLKASLAGQNMSDWAPRGIARVGAGMGLINAGATLNPMALAMMPMASPRVIGEAAYALGKGAKVADSISTALGGDKLLEALMAAYQAGNIMRPLQNSGQGNQGQ